VSQTLASLSFTISLLFSTYREEMRRYTKNPKIFIKIIIATPAVKVYVNAMERLLFILMENV
ncbi:hypothetical protein L9F63_001196, partial [Diploptera punctata]